MTEKILIVDDSEAIRHFVTSILCEEGFEVFEASNADEAEELILATNDLKLVYLDVHMPGILGVDLLAKISKHITDHEIQVVMLTTDANPNLIASAKGHGAKGWIVKPAKKELLVGLTKKLLLQ
jgi:two-component system, chemotaxis family, chemotaxis protein CheY